MFIKEKREARKNKICQYFSRLQKKKKLTVKRLNVIRCEFSAPGFIAPYNKYIIIEFVVWNSSFYFISAYTQRVEERNRRTECMCEFQCLALCAFVYLFGPIFIIIIILLLLSVCYYSYILAIVGTDVRIYTFHWEMNALRPFHGGRHVITFMWCTFLSSLPALYLSLRCCFHRCWSCSLN